MGESKTLKIDELCIWSDNPRCGYNSSKNKLTEKQAINVLIDIVTADKMHNLAKNIFENNGLAKNFIPTVVKKENQYLVYDGNRRISCLKILNNPEIVEDNGFKEKINVLVKEKNLEFLKKVDVYVTDEDEALRLMDLAHSGEQDGIGTIPWDAYNRDLSLVQRKGEPQYPWSFAVVKCLGWKYKKDFVLFYTDIERIFGNKKFIQKFGLKIDKLDSKKLKHIIEYLKQFKDLRKATSFSRLFNETDTVVQDFCDWYDSVIAAKNKYALSLKNAIVYSDLTAYSFDISRLSIKENNEKSNVVSFNLSDLIMSYISPLGKNSKKLDLKIVGDWTEEVTYKGITIKAIVTVKQPLSQPEIIFKEEVLNINVGNTYDLKLNIAKKQSIHFFDMPIKRIESVGTNTAILINEVFAQNNKVGNYVISYVFDNEGKEVAKAIQINVVENNIPLRNKSKEKIFCCIGELKAITFSFSVGKLVEEINDLFDSKYDYVVVSSSRCIAELCFDFLESNVAGYPAAPALIDKIKNFKQYFDKTRLNQIVAGEQISFRTLKNQIDSIDEVNLNANLNLAAHKSAKYLNKESLKKNLKNDLNVIIDSCELIYRHP